MIVSRLRLCYGRPPADAQAFTHDCLELFASRGPKSAERRVALLTWFNGDWRNVDVVEHYVDTRKPAEQRTHAFLAKAIARAAAQALASRCPPTFPRHRWTGADLSVDEVGVLMAVHGLLVPTYLAFLASSGCRLAGGPPSHVGASGATGEGFLALGAPEPSEEALPTAAAEGAAAAEGMPQAAAHPQESGAPAVDQHVGVDWAQINARAMQAGHQFVTSSSPLGELVLVRRCLEPFRELMSAHLTTSGSAWERMQRAKQASRVASFGSPGGREFRIVIAATQTHESRFFSRTERLFRDPGCWSLLPGPFVTARSSALAFRLVSRMGCAVQELLALPHSQYPYRLFLLLEDEDFAESILEADPCEFDAFSKSFVERFRAEGLTSPDALATLRCLATVLKTDIVDIEAKHASMRRYLKAAPQAKVMSGKLLSGVWTCKRWAKRQQRMGGPGLRAQAKKMARAGVGKKKARRHTRSAWQAFVSVTSRGRRADFRSLRAEYAALSDEEKAKYVRLAAGTRARRPEDRGGAVAKPFGLNSRAVARRLSRQALRDAARRRLGGSSDAGSAGMSTALAVSGLPFDKLLTAARADARMERAVARSDEVAAEKTLAEYREKGRSKVDDLLGSQLAPLAPFAPALQPVPMESVTTFEVALDTARVAEAAVAAAVTYPSAQIGAALDIDWSRKTETISGAGQPAIPDLPKAEQKAAECRACGVCLCSDDGQTLKRFTSCLLDRGLKPHTRPKTANRKLLSDGYIILALTPQSIPEGVRRAEDMVAPDVARDSETVWQHVGLMYLSPFRPTFHSLVPSETGSLVVGGVALAATNEFVSCCRALQHCDAKRAWWSQLFKVWDGKMPLGAFAPGVVSALPLTSPVLFWFPRRAPRAPESPCDDAAMLLLEGVAAGDGRWEDHGDEVGEGHDDALFDDTEGAAEAAEGEDTVDLTDGLQALLEELIDAEEAVGAAGGDALAPEGPTHAEGGAASALPPRMPMEIGGASDSGGAPHRQRLRSLLPQMPRQPSQRLGALRHRQQMCHADPEGLGFTTPHTVAGRSSTILPRRTPRRASKPLAAPKRSTANSAD